MSDIVFNVSPYLPISYRVRQPDTTVQELRTLLKEAVDAEEARHPQFQNKEWLTRAKEALNESRK